MPLRTDTEDLIGAQNAAQQAPSYLPAAPTHLPPPPNPLADRCGYTTNHHTGEYCTKKKTTGSCYCADHAKFDPTSVEYMRVEVNMKKKRRDQFKAKLADVQERFDDANIEWKRVLKLLQLREAATGRSRTNTPNGTPKKNSRVDDWSSDEEAEEVDDDSVIMDEE